MSWTPGRVGLLKTLYRSYWSVGAMALVLDVTRAAVRRKIKRLLRTDAEMELALLHRAMRLRAGHLPVSVDQARALLTMSRPQAVARFRAAASARARPPDPDPCAARCMRAPAPLTL